MMAIAPLFVPGDRPERFAKAAASGADAVIVDLEDAVAPAAKNAARAALATLPDVPVIVRINAAGTPWHARDLAAVAGLRLAAVMLPKAERVADLAPLAGLHPVIALIESAVGVAAARALAASGHVARLAFGSVDFAADLGCDHVREALAPACGELVMASRLAGLPAPLDGVTVDLDPTAAADDARYARALGFGGKLLIHPRQVAPVLHAFLPAPAEIAWAHRVLATGEGAVAIDGAMVDEPVRIRARGLLARAGTTPMEPTPA